MLKQIFSLYNIIYAIYIMEELQLNNLNGKWTTEVEELLEKLRINCVNLSEYHHIFKYTIKSVKVNTI